MFLLLIPGCSNSNIAEQTSMNPPQTTPRVEKCVYKQTPQGELAMYVHFPEDWTANDKRPVIIFFFGGGYTGGSVNQFEFQADYLASRGMVSARADYRVKNRHGVTPDKCVEDARSAVRWLRKNSKRLGIDPNKLIASGASSGGNLAACTMIAKSVESEGEDLSISTIPQVMVLFNPELRLDNEQMIERLGINIAREISPTLHLNKSSPPALILFGTNDSLKVMGDEYWKKAEELGVRADKYIAEGQGHGFFNRSPWRERTLIAADEFLVSLGYLEGSPTIKVSELDEKIESLYQAVATGEIEKVKQLISENPEVDVRDNRVVTLLHTAAINGYLEIAELLIENGADVNAKNDNGGTPLNVASQQENKDVVELLIDRGANINNQNNNGMTPLHHACRDGFKNIVELLVDKGADIKAKNNNGETPLSLAIRYGHVDIVEMLLVKGADFVDSIEQNNTGRTPLGLATENGNTKIVELIRKHANQSGYNKEIMSIYDYAVIGDTEKVKLLISEGINVNTKTQFGATALHWASTYGHIEIVELLIQNGANFDVQDNSSYSPLFLACQGGHKDVVELLLDKGADFNVKTNEGKTPLAIAKERGNTAIVELLKKHGAKE